MKIGNRIVDIGKKGEHFLSMEEEIYEK